MNKDQITVITNIKVLGTSSILVSIKLNDLRTTIIIRYTLVYYLYGQIRVMIIDIAHFHYNKYDLYFIFNNRMGRI